MIYFEENNLDKSKIQKQIEEHSELITNLTNLLIEKRSTFLLCLERISTSIDNLKDVKNTAVLFNMLDKVKNVFSILNSSIETLTKLKNNLKVLNENLFSQYYINEVIFIDVKNFNIDFDTFLEKYFTNSSNIESFLKEYINGCTFIFKDSINNEPSNETVNETPVKEANVQQAETLNSIAEESENVVSSNKVDSDKVSESNDSEEKPNTVAEQTQVFESDDIEEKTDVISSDNAEPTPASESDDIEEKANMISSDNAEPTQASELSSLTLQSIENLQSLEGKQISDISKEIELSVDEFNLNFELQDNRILLISEKENKVYLPYYVKDLKDILKKNPKKYSNIQDIINEEYIIPLSRFKYPVLSRFKEAFSLMKYREKASITECLDLAFELSFNNLLNPAIIAACRNLDELDIYLDCLDANELNKFTIFEVKYDVAPILKND